VTSASHRVVTVQSLDGGEREDSVVVERALTIRVRGRSDEAQVLATTMRTPGDDLALAVGLCFSEGLLGGVSDLVDVQRCPDATPDERDDVVLVTIDRSHVDLGHLHRHGVMTSACGLCGRTLLEDIVSRARVGSSPVVISPEVLQELPASLRRAQHVFGRTGGLHAVATVDSTGFMSELREDVGRHNAFDKVVGRAVRADRTPLDGQVVVLSGRASYELLAKAAIAGAPVVAAIGAPSSLAIALAESVGITLIGFLRPDRGNVYTHPARVARTHARGSSVTS
jgi:FdhD protein